MTEAWLGGPVAGVDRILMPAAHALLQARAEIEQVASDLTPAELAVTPGGAASLSFHLKHIPGAIDRLLSYSRGQQLTDEQRRYAAAEKSVDARATGKELVQVAIEGIDRALVAIRAADPSTLFDARTVGRQALPSTIFGLLGHIAEHTTRHTGQLVTTVKIVRGLGLART